MRLPPALFLSCLVAACTGASPGGPEPIAAPPGGDWPSSSTPIALEEAVELMLHAPEGLAVSPVTVCTRATLAHEAVTLPAPAVVVEANGDVAGQIAGGTGCVGVELPAGSARLTATWRGQQAEATVEVFGSHPIQALPGDPDAPVLRDMPDLSADTLDPDRNARFALTLTADATRGQLATLLKDHDAALVGTMELGGQAFLSIAMASEVDLEALMATAEGLEALPFVETAIPDASVPAAAIREALDAPAPSGQPPPPTEVFTGPYPEFVPAGEPLGEGAVAVVATGTGDPVSAGDEVELILRRHARRGERVLVRTETWTGPVAALDPVVRTALPRLAPGGRARVWPRAGTESIVDVEVVSARPRPADPEACREADVVRLDLEQVCVAPLEPAPDGLVLEPGSRLLLRGKPEGCHSSSATTPVANHLSATADGLVEGGVCVSYSKDVLGMHTADCGGAGGAVGVWTVPGTPATLTLGDTPWTLPDRIPAGGVCPGQQPFEREELRSLEVSPTGAVPVMLDSPAGHRYRLDGDTVEVPAGAYTLRADLGAGETITGVVRLERRRSVPIGCDAQQCRCGVGVSGDDTPNPACTPVPEPAWPGDADGVREAPPHHGAWPVVPRAQADAVRQDGMRCTVVDAVGRDGALGEPQVEGCEAPWSDVALAWARTRPIQPQLGPAAAGVRQIRTEVRWPAGALPEVMVGDPDGASFGRSPAGLPLEPALPREPRHARVHIGGRAWMGFESVALTCPVTLRVAADGRVEGTVVRDCPDAAAEAIHGSTERWRFAARSGPWAAALVVDHDGHRAELRLPDEATDDVVSSDVAPGEPVDVESWTPADPPRLSDLTLEEGRPVKLMLSGETVDGEIRHRVGDGRRVLVVDGLPPGFGWVDAAHRSARHVFVLHGSESDVLLLGGSDEDGGLALSPTAAYPDVASLLRQLRTPCPLEVTATVPLQLDDGTTWTLSLPPDRKEWRATVDGEEVPLKWSSRTGDRPAWKLGDATVRFGATPSLRPSRGNDTSADRRLSLLAAAGGGELGCETGDASCTTGRPTFTLEETASCTPVRIPVGAVHASLDGAVGARIDGELSAVQPPRYAFGRAPPPSVVVFRSRQLEVTLPAAVVRGLREVTEGDATLILDSLGQPGWLELDGERHTIGAFPVPLKPSTAGPEPDPAPSGPTPSELLAGGDVDGAIALIERQVTDGTMVGIKPLADFAGELDRAGHEADAHALLDRHPHPEVLWWTMAWITTAPSMEALVEAGLDPERGVQLRLQILQVMQQTGRTEDAARVREAVCPEAPRARVCASD